MNLEPSEIRLRVVALEKVMLHEGLDPMRVERLAGSLRERELLRNPIVVTEDQGEYIVLDGATRSTALREMGIPHIVVQIVSYDTPHVGLGTWHHALTGFNPQSLLQAARQIPDLQALECDDRHLQRTLRRRETLFGLRPSHGPAYAFSSSTHHKGQLRQLNQLVSAYAGQAEVHRVSQVDMDEIAEQIPGVDIVVFFPTFQPEDVMRAARNEIKIPMGITRHVIAGRALGLNVPLSFIAGGASLEEKNRWLDQWVAERIHHCQVRLYAEPTFIFEKD